MSFGKVIFSTFLKFFSDRNKNSILNSQALFLDAILAAVKKEISDLILKISVALVAVSVVIYSLIVIGQHFHAYMLIYEKGILFSVLFFSLLAIGCGFIIFKLFYEQDYRQNIFETLFSKKNSQNFNFEKLYTLFIEGLNEGLSAGEYEGSSKKQNKDEPPDFNLPH